MALPREWKNPELWLMRRLRRGEITGYKVGHTWLMRQQDVDDLIARHLNNKPVEDAKPKADIIAAGLSARAARRLGAAS